MRSCEDVQPLHEKAGLRVPDESGTELSKARKRMKEIECRNENERKRMI